MDRTEIREDLEKKNENPDKDKRVDTGSKEETGSEENPKLHTKDTEDQAAADVKADATEKLKEELESAKDKYIRLYSEFENFRKRTAKEKLELIQSANEQLITTLLPVADDFDRAQNAFADNKAEDIAGFFLIYSKFKKVLEVYGVKTMDTVQGTDFNPDFHDAISQVPAPTPALKGKIVDVVEKGYLLNDKVIRYAKVVVGN